MKTKRSKKNSSIIQIIRSTFITYIIFSALAGIFISILLGIFYFCLWLASLPTLTGITVFSLIVGGILTLIAFTIAEYKSIKKK